MKPTTTEAAICCMIVSNPCGGMRPHGWQKRVNDLIRAQDQELATLRAERDDARKVSDRWASEAVVLRASEAAAVECYEALQAKLARTEIERDYDRRQTAHLQTVVDRLNAQLAAMTDSRDAAVARVGE